MLGGSWVEDYCTWFIVLGILLCVMVILFDKNPLVGRAKRKKEAVRREKKIVKRR
jgi:hypothetical protein